MPKDPRTYITVHDGLPDHPKIEALSDAGFRLLISSWCWCSRQLTDGHIPAGLWSRRGTPKARKELIAAGLVEPTDDGFYMHDYTDHQRTADEVRTIREAKAESGQLGAHRRWHQKKRTPGCPLCYPEAPSGPTPIPIANQ